MAAPDVNLDSMPTGGVMAVLMAWDDTNNEFRAVELDSGRLNINATVATGDAPSTGAITSVGDATSSTTILAANSSRKGATIYNDSDAILYLALANVTASTSTYTVQVPAKAFFELPLSDGGPYTGIIVGIWASDAGGSARVTELT